MPPNEAELKHFASARRLRQRGRRCHPPIAWFLVWRQRSGRGSPSHLEGLLSSGAFRCPRISGASQAHGAVVNTAVLRHCIILGHSRLCRGGGTEPDCPCSHDIGLREGCNCSRELRNGAAQPRGRWALPLLSLGVDLFRCFLVVAKQPRAEPAFAVVLLAVVPVATLVAASPGELVCMAGERLG
jgi:hypothetical protein